MSRKRCGDCEFKVSNAFQLPSGRVTSGEWCCRKYRDQNGRWKSTTGIIEIDVLDRINPFRLDECETPYCTGVGCTEKCQ